MALVLRLMSNVIEIILMLTVNLITTKNMSFNIALNYTE